MDWETKRWEEVEREVAGMEASAAARTDKEIVDSQSSEVQTPDDNVVEPEPVDAETAEENSTDQLSLDDESSEWESADEEIVTHGATATILRGVDWRDEGIDDEIQFSD